MIRLGFDLHEKEAVIKAYCGHNCVKKVFIFAPERFRCEYHLDVPFEHVEWNEIILYRFFYRLLQEIDESTLLVFDECMRVQNRYDLTYSCIRHFLNQTHHQIIFQYLPIIDGEDDFMILFDFDTRSRWKKEHIRASLQEPVDIDVKDVYPRIIERKCHVSSATQKRYQKEKRRLIDGIGLKDPHTIPRNLYLIGGKEKAIFADKTKSFIGRNNRLGMENFATYRDVSDTTERIVFELPHNFLDFSDFLIVTRQRDVTVIACDLKVDEWYLDRYCEWVKRIQNVYTIIRGAQDRP